MKQLVIFFLGALLISACEKKPDLPTVASGSLVRLESFGSGNGVKPRNVDIWLPDGYSEQGNYAVLYMHDGQMLYDSTVTWNKQEWQVDEVASELIGKGTVNPFIVVGIWNGDEDRHADYFPQKPFEQVKVNYGDSLLSANPEFEGLNMVVQSDAYVNFIVEELKPYIDENYAVASDPDNTYVMGSSMGGLISMYALAEYPQIFGGAACLWTHWIGVWVENKVIPEAFGEYLGSKLPELEGKKLYFDHGTETLDAKYNWAQKHIDQIVENDTTSNLIYKSAVFEGTAHDEISWANRLDIPITFLLGNE